MVFAGKGYYENYNEFVDPVCRTEIQPTKLVFLSETAAWLESFIN
jgi:hypothetical protein